MNSSQYYSERPEMPCIDVGTDKNSVGKLPVPDIDKLSFERCPHNNYPAPTSNGFLISNGAMLLYKASFYFKYDNGTTKSAVLNIGDKVYITCNKPGKNMVPNIITAVGILKNIERTEDNAFILTVDASSENNSSVYKIGSRAVLDAGKIEPEEDVPTIPLDKPSTPSADDVEIEGGNEEIVDNHHHHHHHHHHHCPPPIIPDPTHPCGDKQPIISIANSKISWTNKVLSMEFDKTRGYSVLDIIYAKKEPVDTMLIVYDLEGHIVFKALDTSKRVSMQANFVWPLRDYVSYIDANVSLIDRLDKYTLDSAGKYVMTADSILDEDVRNADKSNEIFPEATQFFIEVVAGKDLLEYNPFVHHKINGKTESIIKRFTISANNIKAAFYPYPDEEEPEKPVEDPSTDEPSKDVEDPTKEPSTDEPTTENPSDTKDPVEGPSTNEPTTEDPSNTQDPVEKPSNPDNTQETEDPTTGNENNGEGASSEVPKEDGTVTDTENTPPSSEGTTEENKDSSTGTEDQNTSTPAEGETSVTP